MKIPWFIFIKKKKKNPRYTKSLSKVPYILKILQRMACMKRATKKKINNKFSWSIEYFENIFLPYCCLEGKAQKLGEICFTIFFIIGSLLLYYRIKICKITDEVTIRLPPMNYSPVHIARLAHRLLIGVAQLEASMIWKYHARLMSTT